VYGMGASVTLFMMAMYVGNSIGPVLLGGIADRLGLESVFYTAALSIGAGVLVFALMVSKSGTSPPLTYFQKMSERRGRP